MRKYRYYFVGVLFGAVVASTVLFGIWYAYLDSILS